MAHIIGYNTESAQKIPFTHLFFIIIVAVALIGFMLAPADNWKEHVSSMLGTVAVILVIVGVALNKVNPMGWKQLFHKKEFEQLVRADSEIIAVLRSLNDDYCVLYDFNLELLHVEFLVLGRQGFFVISKATSPDPLWIEDETLMAGTESLAKNTGTLWRICHLINILIKKGYGVEIMPKPILVTANTKQPAIQEFDGISITGTASLIEEIESHSKDSIAPEKLRGFADYLEKRYFK